MNRYEHFYGKVLYALAALACVLLLGLTALICVDVFMRYVDRSGVAWANEVSEYVLYLITFLVAPHLLREGLHVRVDLLLRAVSSRTAWVMEWFIDISGLVISGVLLWAGVKAVRTSIAEGSLVIKSLSFPDWWLLVPVPVCLFLLGVEFIFRMYRLANAPRRMRAEATSAG